MNYLNKNAARIFGELVKRLNGEDHVRIDNTNSKFMPVVVERLYKYSKSEVFFGYCLYSITHYGKQNGDAMRDPDMTFIAKEHNGEWYVLPASFRNDYVGVDEESIFYEMDGGHKWSPSLQRKHATFANDWMVNISLQQKILQAEEKEA